MKYLEIASLIIFFIGIYGLIGRRNILKSIISLNIIQSALVLFFVSIDYTHETTSPIQAVDPALAANPLPQALMITVIVIGISVTAVTLTMFINLYHKYGTTNWSKVLMKMRGEL